MCHVSPTYLPSISRGAEPSYTVDRVLHPGTLHWVACELSVSSWPACCSATLAAAPQAATDGASKAQARVRCEFLNARWRLCNVPGEGEARLLRQISKQACVRNHSWGEDHRGVWVARGCRGEFTRVSAELAAEGSGPRTVRCESSDGLRRRCAADTRGGVVPTEQLSGMPCELGRSWGFDADGIWVSLGCRGDPRCNRRRARARDSGDALPAGMTARTRRAKATPCVANHGWRTGQLPVACPRARGTGSQAFPCDLRRRQQLGMVRRADMGQGWLPCRVHGLAQVTLNERHSPDRSRPHLVLRFMRDGYSRIQPAPTRSMPCPRCLIPCSCAWPAADGRLDRDHRDAGIGAASLSGGRVVRNLCMPVR